MLIDKEVVRSAKESLGDQNFDLITESLVDQGLISLTDIDEKNKRIRCPFHAGDNTPSCVYDKKRLRLHCFGCQRDYDVIDAFKDSGMTYLEACQKLFEKANVQYAFSEKGLKTQKPDYVYPTVPSKNHDRSKVEQYWNKRGISNETLDYFDVREDEHGNSVLITYDLNDVATVVKYKPSHKPDKSKGESKCWFQKGASKDDLLFNMNRINTTEPLLITEGECLTGDTEILTNDGWVRLDEYGNQDVLQVNNDFSATFVRPLCYVHKNYSGKMYSLKVGGNYSLTTTAGHNWVYTLNGRLIKRTAESFPHSLGVAKLPTTVRHDCVGVGIPDDLLRLWVAVSADGSIAERGDWFHCRVSLKKERKISRLHEILQSVGIKYTVTVPKSRPEYTYFGFRLPKWMTKEFPSWLYTRTSAHEKEVFLNELIHWDGNSVPNRKQFEYSTIIYNNAITVQTIAHLCGQMSTIIRRTNKKGDVWYKVSVLQNKNSISFQNGWTDIYDYNGDVYCVTVPSGMILVKKDGHIAITGNCDALTAKEAGYANVVTPLNGAGSFNWVERCWSFLEQFDSIIICSDNDEPGQKMRNELVYRLGSWRCKVVEIPTSVTWSDGKEYPVNDLNDMFHAYGKDAVLKAIINAKDTPVKSVVDFADVTELELSQMDGVETGLESLDAELYKLYYGTVTLISGAPAAGKSSLINSIIANAMEEGVKCWLFSKEMPNYIEKNWINLQLCGPRNIVKYEDKRGRVFWNVKPSIRGKIEGWAHGRLYLYRDEESNESDDVISSMTECVRKFGCKLLIIDNLMLMQLFDKEGELKAQKEFMSKLVQFAIKYNVAVILVAHPRKFGSSVPVETDIGLADISGTSAIGNLAHRSISLRRITDREREQNESKFAKYNVKITITKDRLLGRSADTAIGVYYDVPSRRFFTNYQEFARQYSWDTTVYPDKIPLPTCLANEVKIQQEEEEVFGHV